jgi:PAS domain S-box-containing protein
MVGVFVLDNQFRVRWVNQALERYFGLRRNEVLGKDKRQLVRQRIKNIFEDSESFAERVLATYKDNTYIQNFECHVLAGDSREERWLEHWSQPIRSGLYAGGRIEHYTDITERKRTEEALREGEARYRQLFATVSDAIVVFDGETKQFVDVNEATVRLYGYSREELLRLTLLDITAQPEESTISIEQALAGELTRVPLRYHKKKDGTVFPVEIAASVVASGNRRLLCGVVRDITERTRAEEEARQRQAELAHVSRLTLMGEMASSLSHDISQPLSTILFYARGCVRRIRSGAANPAALLDVMEKVALQAEAAGRIVRRLREFVSKRAPHFSTVDVNEVVRRSLSLVQSEISEGRITARFQAAESLPPVRADSVQIKQVILNLVRNGMEAMQGVEAGQRELTITTSSSAGDTITVAVHDVGAGLSAEVAERVFDSFFTTKPDGMGMGLSISRSIIEVHGGRLWAVPNAERGATFQFSLPVMKGTADEGA